MKSDKITQERLDSLDRQFIEDGFNDIRDKEVMMLIREVKAWREDMGEKVPVAYVSHYESGALHGVCEKDDPVKMEWLKRGFTITPLYDAPPARQVLLPDWTNEQCLEFLSIAFRHAEIKGDIEMDDIRLGIKMVNSGRAAMMQEAK